MRAGRVEAAVGVAVRQVLQRFVEQIMSTPT